MVSRFKVRVTLGQTEGPTSLPLTEPRRGYRGKEVRDLVSF